MPSLSNEMVMVIKSIADTAGIVEAEAAVAKLDEAQLKNAETSSKWSKGMMVAGAAVAVGVGALAVESIHAAGNFQQALVKLTTSAGESTSNLKLVGDGILQIARDTGASTDDLTAAIYKVDSANIHGADSLVVLKAATQGAKAEGSDLTTVADALSSVMVDYKLKASDAADTTSKLVAATAAGKMSFQDLAAAMPAVLPMAANAHIALGDILGDMAAMTIHGMSAQQAADNLSHAIGKMQSPTAAMGKELAMLGLTTTQLADDMKNKGLSGVLQEIAGKIQALAPAGSDKVILNLKTALSNLSPAVQDLGSKLFDGSMTMKDYSKAAAGLDPISSKQAMSFATLAGQTHKIGNEQMTGAQVMQNYGQALYAATGDATSLKVALMLTGDNAAVANKAIKDVSGATAEAGGNVRGWSDIQGNFNTKLAQLGQWANTSSISLGMQLLPIVSHGIDLFLSWNQAIATFTEVHSSKLIAAFTGLAVAVGTFAIGSLVSGMYAFISAGGIATTSAKLFASALMLIEANPIVLGLSILAGALTMVGMGMLTTNSSTNTLSGALDRQKKANQDLKQSILDVKDAQDKLKNSQLDAEGAALRVEGAQNDYNAAVANYGPNSYQARSASYDLQRAQLDLKAAQDKVKDATQAVIDKQNEQKKDAANVAAANDAVKDSAYRAAGGYTAMAGAIDKAVAADKKAGGTGFSGGAAASNAALGITKHAVGGLSAPGGLSLVGENGPELVQMPRGATVFTNHESSRMVGNGSVVNHFHGDIILGDSTAVTAWFNKLDQDSLLASKGMSLNRGVS